MSPFFGYKMWTLDTKLEHDPLGVQNLDVIFLGIKPGIYV